MPPLPLSKAEVNNVLISSRSQRLHIAEKSAAALVLTFGAGFVDIVGYLSAYKVFTAHLTGTTVHMAQGIAVGDAAQIVIGAGVLGAFVIGSLVGRLVIEAGARMRVRSIASVTLGMEAALLLSAASFSITSESLAGGIHGSGYWFLVLLAAAMGLQTATITRIGSLTVHTTFVTGMINKFCQLLSHVVVDSYELAQSRDAAVAQKRRNSAKRATFFFSIWLFYVAGAVSGTWSTHLWKLHALYVPMVLFFLVCIADLTMPLALEEERDESER